MDQDFSKIWFQGFEEGLDKMTPESRSCLLKCCAKRCADSGVLELYRKHYTKVNGDRDEFYRRIEELGGARGEVAVSGKEYYIYFPQCYCDLHLSAGVNSPNLCECSRQSILYVGEALWGKDCCTVENMGTVLSGSSECKFKVVF